MLVNKKIKLDLTDIDGNAFSILGAFSARARREGWDKKEIEKVCKVAKSGDYDNLVATIADHCEGE